MNDAPDNELFSAYLDGELTVDEQAEVQRLLASSPAARQLLDELRALSATLQAMPQHRLEEDLSQRVLRMAERRILTEPKLAEEPAARSAPPMAQPSIAQPSIAQRLLNPRALFWPGVAVAVALMLMIFDRDRDPDRPADEPRVASLPKRPEAPEQPAAATSITGIVETADGLEARDGDERLALGRNPTTPGDAMPGKSEGAAEFGFAGGRAPRASSTEPELSGQRAGLEKAAPEKGTTPPAGPLQPQRAVAAAQKPGAGNGERGQGPSVQHDFGGAGQVTVDHLQRTLDEVDALQSAELGSVAGSVVVLDVSTEAAHQGLFDAILPLHGIAWDETRAKASLRRAELAVTPAADGEKLSKKLASWGLGQQKQDVAAATLAELAKAGRVDLVLVEATSQQIEATLADLHTRSEAFVLLAVEPAPGVKEHQSWQRFDRRGRQRQAVRRGGQTEHVRDQAEQTRPGLEAETRTTDGAATRASGLADRARGRPGYAWRSPALGIALNARFKSEAAAPGGGLGGGPANQPASTPVEAKQSVLPPRSGEPTAEDSDKAADTAGQSQGLGQKRHQAAELTAPAETQAGPVAPGQLLAEPLVSTPAERPAEPREGALYEQTMQQKDAEQGAAKAYRGSGVQQERLESAKQRRAIGQAATRDRQPDEEQKKSAGTQLAPVTRARDGRSQDGQSFGGVAGTAQSAAVREKLLEESDEDRAARQSQPSGETQAAAPMDKAELKLDAYRSPKSPDRGDQEHRRVEPSEQEAPTYLVLFVLRVAPDVPTAAAEIPAASDSAAGNAAAAEIRAAPARSAEDAAEAGKR